jgi:hypothetical protein
MPFIDTPLFEYVVSKTVKLIDQCKTNPALIYCKLINTRNNKTIFTYIDNEIYSQYFGLIKNIDNTTIGNILLTMEKEFIYYNTLIDIYDLSTIFTIENNIAKYKINEYSYIYIELDNIIEISYKNNVKYLNLPLNSENIKFCIKLLNDSRNSNYDLFNLITINISMYNKYLNTLNTLYKIIGDNGLRKLMPSFRNNLIIIKNHSYNIKNIKFIIADKYPKYTRLINIVPYKRFILFHIFMCILVLYLVSIFVLY